jgi:tetratricopeptide (TPR) repeat protein
MRLFDPLVLCLLLLVAAAPATAPTTRPAEAGLQSAAFWIERAQVEWSQITDPRLKPWDAMADRQAAMGDNAGLARTLAELNRIAPPPQATGYPYANHPIVGAYADLAGHFARIGDAAGLKRAIDVVTDRTRRGSDKDATPLDGPRSRAAWSLVDAGRDGDALAVAETMQDLDQKQDTILHVATLAAKAGRTAESNKALLAARRLAPLVDRENAPAALGRVALAEAYILCGQPSKAVEIYESLPESARVRADLEFSVAYGTVGNRAEAIRYAQLAVASVRKTGWSNGYTPVGEVAHRVATLGEPALIEAIQRLANEAKSARVRVPPRDVHQPPPPSEFAPEKLGPMFAAACYAGLADGFAWAGRPDAAHEQIKLAVATIMAVQSKPPSISWYLHNQLPVVRALLMTGDAPGALAIAKSLPTKDLEPSRGSFNALGIQSFKSALAEAHHKSGNVREAAALYNQLGERVPILIDQLVAAGNLQTLLDEVARLSAPHERCRFYLRVAELLTNPPSGVGPATLPAGSR